jgi:hypothetical protein
LTSENKELRAKLRSREEVLQQEREKAKMMWEVKQT